MYRSSASIRFVASVVFGYSTSGRRKQTPAKRPRTAVIFGGKSVVYAGRTAGGGTGGDMGVCSGRCARSSRMRCEDDEKSRSSRAGLCRIRRNCAARIPPLFPPAERPAFSPMKRQRRRGYDGAERLTSGGRPFPRVTVRTGRVSKTVWNFDSVFFFYKLFTSLSRSESSSVIICAKVIKRPKNWLKKIT